MSRPKTKDEFWNEFEKLGKTVHDLNETNTKLSERVKKLESKIPDTDDTDDTDFLSKDLGLD